MTPQDMYNFIRDVCLAPRDQEPQAEQAARRKGHPKSMREMKLEEIKLREAEEYRTGIGESLCGSNEIPILINRNCYWSQMQRSSTSLYPTLTTIRGFT